MLHAIFDTELIGSEAPLFLVCVQILETGEQFKFWHHKRGHTAKLEKMLVSGEYTWVGFNSTNFDMPLMAAAIMGHNEHNLKQIAQAIIDENMRSWETYRSFEIEFLGDAIDHIDLIEVAPGVMDSLKTYMARMHYPTMIDMPFDHNHDMSAADQKLCEKYCFNDIGGTAMLFQKLRTEIDLRIEMSAEHGLDLRSKSDAQVAETILKKAVGINKKEAFIPSSVHYSVPDFIKTKNETVQEVIDLFETSSYEINRANGSPIERPWMKDPVSLNEGLYKVGLGGLHSQHDVKFYAEASDDLLISDFDVASYYPNIMMVAGLIPRFGGNKGELFIQEYRAIYEARIKAKREGNKKIANALKISLNGTFGKLGSIYSALYSPDLLIAVTITGQINLLCLIAELEGLRGVKVYSANTDGITVGYSPKARDRVLKVFAQNAKRTGFEYEETPYAKIAMKDVNNYLAVTTDGKVKRKGLYAETSLMKNPTMEICSLMAIDYLVDGILPEHAIKKYTDPHLFMSVRGVKGGGVQHIKTEWVDDWGLIEDHGSAQNVWESLTLGKKVKRMSRPKPVERGVGGTPFGRVARWYMTTKKQPAITYCVSGNQVPKTEGAQICLTMPTSLPKDLDYAWYINETKEILNDLGITDPRVMPAVQQ